MGPRCNRLDVPAPVVIVYRGEHQAVLAETGGNTLGSMKPGKYDRTQHVRITGAELGALKRLDLSETFGLDRRIDQYEGKRPIGLDQCDLDCLLAAWSAAIEGHDPFVSRQGRLTLKRLQGRLQAVHDAAYRTPRV